MTYCYTKLVRQNFLDLSESTARTAGSRGTRTREFSLLAHDWFLWGWLFVREGYRIELVFCGKGLSSYMYYGVCYATGRGRTTQYMQVSLSHTSPYLFLLLYYDLCCDSPPDVADTVYDISDFVCLSCQKKTKYLIRSFWWCVISIMLKNVPLFLGFVYCELKWKRNNTR